MDGADLAASITNDAGIKSHAKCAWRRQIWCQPPNVPGGGSFGAVSYMSMLEEFACPLSNTQMHPYSYTSVDWAHPAKLVARVTLSLYCITCAYLLCIAHITYEPKTPDARSAQVMQI